jgi:SAM-dependent methyltransferase
MNRDTIISKLRSLSPWHLNIHLIDDIYTSVGNQDKYDDFNKQGISLVDPTKMKELFQNLYSDGLKSKSFLDVGCNSGGYCFLANELGARYAYGFDAREHWINQANFIKEVKEIDDSSIEFRVHHINDLVNCERKFDVTLFKGVFYHLPDPIHAMEMLSNITNDIIIVDSACRMDIPEEAMISKFEGTDKLMSGVDGLSWHPGGPKAIHNLGRHFGFNYFFVVSNSRRRAKIMSDTEKETNVGRFCTILSRTNEFLERMHK